MTIYDKLFEEEYKIDKKIIDFVNKNEEKLKNRFQEFSDIASIIKLRF